LNRNEDFENEIQRVLKPQGVFLISDLRRSWLGMLSRNLRAAYTPEEVRDLLDQSELGSKGLSSLAEHTF
jgi:ubiquinone/menaquinone biosynthesis C-methylase UbiE